MKRYLDKNGGIKTAYHNLEKPNEHSDSKNIIIGDKCWIGMNSVILPSVVLENNAIVRVGSVVIKNFPDGRVVIAGNPAKKKRYD